MTEEGSMEDSSDHTDGDGEQANTESKTTGCSPSSNSIDIYEDILFFSPLTEKSNETPHFKKPNRPPPEEESVDLYSEFMDKKSKWNNLDSEVNNSSQDDTDLCIGVDDIRGIVESAKSRDDFTAPVRETEGDVNLDLFTEVLTDELQQKHDYKVEITKKYAVAEARNKELESELNITKEEIEKIKAENVIIKKNMSSLLLTAKTELKRKDDEIKRLNSLLAKKNINNFWSRREDPKKTKEMSPGRQKVADIWNNARKSRSGDNTPSKRSKDSDSDSVKRKRNELSDHGTPKRQKVSPSRDSGTPTSSRKELIDQGTPKRQKVSPSRHSRTPTSRKHKTYVEEVDSRENKKQAGKDKESGRSLRYSSRSKSDEKGNKENRDEQRSRGKDKNCSNQHTRNSSEKSVSEDKKISGDSRKDKSDKKSSNSRLETKQGGVEKTPGVKDLRDILKRKREGKAAVSDMTSISSSDKKCCASDFNPPSHNDTVSRTERESSPCSKKRVIAKVNESEGHKTENNISALSDQKCYRTINSADCDTSEGVRAISDTTIPKDTESTLYLTVSDNTTMILPVSDSTARKQRPNCSQDKQANDSETPETQTNDIENSGSYLSLPEKYASGTTETIYSSPEQCPKITPQEQVINSPEQQSLKASDTVTNSSEQWAQKAAHTKEINSPEQQPQNSSHIDVSKSHDQQPQTQSHTDKVISSEQRLQKESEIDEIDSHTLHPKTESHIDVMDSHEQQPQKALHISVTNSLEQHPEKGSQNDGSRDVSEEVLSESSQPYRLSDTQTTPARQEKRRIKPIMISSKKSATAKGICKDGHSCFDAVIKNIELRESAEFAQAKVIHFDSYQHEHTFVPTVVISAEKLSPDRPVISCEGKNKETVSEDNSETECSTTPTSGNTSVCESNSKTHVECLTNNMQNVHYSVEENEHILLCTKNPDRDNSYTSVSIEPSSCDISDRECSGNLIIREESCSRVTPYNSSKILVKCRASDAQKDPRCNVKTAEYIPDKSKSKSKKKKKHKRKYPEDSVDKLEGMTKTNLASDLHNETDMDVNIKGTLEVSGISDSKQINVSSRDMNVDTIRFCDKNQISETESVKLDNVSKEPQFDQHKDDVPSNSSVKAGGHFSFAASVHSTTAPNTFVMDKQVGQFKVPCIDARLNGKSPPYHVEPFEFNTFPEFYARSESEDEDRLLIAGVSESEKESKNRDSSFEMDTSEGNAVMCVTEKYMSRCGEMSEGDMCNIDNNDAKSSDKRIFASNLQEHFGDGAENSSGFYPNVISVEVSENKMDCINSGSVSGYGQAHVVCKDVENVEDANSVTKPDQILKDEDARVSGDDNSVINDSIVPVNSDSSVKVLKQTNKTVLDSEWCERNETKKQKGANRQDQHLQLKTPSANSSLLACQKKATFNRQQSLPASANVDIISATRTRSCSAPQSSSIQIASDNNTVCDQVFDLRQVTPCLNPMVPISCQPIDLSVKSEQSPSPGFIQQASTSDYLSGFNVSKDGALDLTKKANLNCTQAKTPSIQNTACNSDNSGTYKTKLQTVENLEGFSAPRPTSLNYDNVRSESGPLNYHKPQNDLKSITLMPVVTLNSNNLDLRVESKKDTEVANVGNGNLSRLTGNESVIIEKVRIEATVVMEDSSSLDEDKPMDVSGKSSNVSIQSLDIHSSGGDDNSEENSAALSPCRVIQNQTTSTSFSESEEDSPSKPETCSLKNVSNTQISSNSSKTSAVSSSRSNTPVSLGTSSTSVQTSSGKLSAVSSVSAGIASPPHSSNSSSSEDDESDSESSEGDQSDSSEHEDSDVCITEDDQNCEKSQSQILAQSLSCESLQSRNLDVVKQDLHISSDSSLSCRDSQDNLQPSKSSSNVSNDGETLFKLPDMSTSAFAKLASTSHLDVSKSHSSSAVKPKSSEVSRKKQPFPVEENSVLSILADSCDGFDCEQDDHKEDCRKYLEDSPAEPEEQDRTQDNKAAESDAEDECIEDGELSDDEASPGLSITKPIINEEESQELAELLKAKKLLEQKINGICKRSSPLSSKSRDRENKHVGQNYSGSRTDGNTRRSSREKDSHRGSKSSGNEHDRFSREIYGNDPRLSDRCSSRYRRDKNEPRHKHCSSSAHRDDRRERHRDSSPISHRSKENHRREAGDRHDRYPVDSRYRNRSRDISESDRSKSSRSSGSHHSSRRSRDYRS